MHPSVVKRRMEENKPKRRRCFFSALFFSIQGGATRRCTTQVDVVRRSTMQHDGRRCEPTLGVARRALNQPMPFKPQTNFLLIFLVANLHVLEPVQLRRIQFCYEQSGSCLTRKFCYA